jgi:hypothetical protein
VAFLFFAAMRAGICLRGAERAFAWIEQRVRELQLTPKEKRFDEIGWVKDIRTAKRLVTHESIYGRGKFGVGLRSVSK